ncbi:MULTISPECIES: YhjD/YihY/BrkB family envelope integrity protein [Nocardiaceae]|uniref:YhjD/YihY/BrkB family envelope integrity protein n=1 Tax=Nocardiaceae TaxID=85025 RepID=UPI00069006AE|nr:MULTISPECIES: YhjD/YihY/BrkB family envelope integrity protein [Rhodococcus]KZF02776.1 transposase [Rhodococcus sp. EPR-147]KZF03586.1 transposase [Rhodococcus sp. EPR-279]
MSENDDVPSAPVDADPDDPRKADSPTELTKTSWLFVLRKTAREFSRDQCTDLAAALTYYAVLSLFPAVLAIVSLLGVFGQGQATVDGVLQIVSDLGPSSAVETLREPITQLVSAPAAGFALVTGVAGALWSASGYVGAFGRAMNRMYEVEEGRPVWKLRPVLLLVTVAALVLIALAAVMLAVSGPVAAAVGDAVGLGDTALTVWNIARWPVVLVIVVLAVALLYYATPNIQQPKFRWISSGAVVAIVVWVAATILFGFYVANFGSYNKTYGSLAGAIVFLLWLWITNLALLFGAELDSELERGRQLQAGMVAEERLQLPPRDTRVSEKNEEKDAAAVDDGRRLRLRHQHATAHSSGAGQRDDRHNRTTHGDEKPLPVPVSGSSTGGDITSNQHMQGETMNAHSGPPSEEARTSAADLSTVQLVERLTDQVSTLVRSEIRSGLEEVKSKGTRLGIGIGITGAGALLLFFGLATLIATAVLGLATVLSAWLAALIVAAAVLVVGGVLAAVGTSRAKNAVPPVPAETVASVNDDITAIKKGIR